jgi:hypothetical protein
MLDTLEYKRFQVEIKTESAGAGLYNARQSVMKPKAKHSHADYMLHILRFSVTYDTLADAGPWESQSLAFHEAYWQAQGRIDTGEFNSW